MKIWNRRTIKFFLLKLFNKLLAYSTTVQLQLPLPPRCLGIPISPLEKSVYEACFHCILSVTGGAARHPLMAEHHSKGSNCCGARGAALMLQVHCLSWATAAQQREHTEHFICSLTHFVLSILSCPSERIYLSQVFYVYHENWKINKQKDTRAAWWRVSQ